MINKNGVSVETAEAMGRAFALLCRDIDEARGIPWRAGESKDCVGVEESNLYRGWLDELGFPTPPECLPGYHVLTADVGRALYEWEASLEADPCYQAFRKALYDEAKKHWAGRCSK